jgi:hypothetical protein
VEGLEELALDGVDRKGFGACGETFSRESVNLRTAKESQEKLIERSTSSKIQGNSGTFCKANSTVLVK